MNIERIHHISYTIDMISLCLFITCAFMMAGCADANISKDDVINLTIWHVYGEQSDSPMDDMIHEFNTTLGKEKGINVTTTNITSVSKLEQELTDALNGTVGAMAVPDLFTSSVHEAIAIGSDRFVDWNDYMSNEQISQLVDEFVESGHVGDTLIALPVIQSASVILMNENESEEFFTTTGIHDEDLETWDGFF